MLNLIACIDKHNSIGIDNNLIYRFTDDLKIFKQKTLNKIVVMGRKTFDSLNNIPLPNRRNLIISNNLTNPVDKSYDVIRNIRTVFDISLNKEVFVIGGKQIYEYFNDFYDEIHLTIVKDDFTEHYQVDHSVKLNISLDNFEIASKTEFEKFNIYVYKRST